MSKKRRLHPIEIAAQNASFDILGYVQQKFKEGLNKKNYGRDSESKEVRPRQMRDAT